MEENDREEGGLSIADIFRTIFTQKWLALIIAFVITVAGTLTLYYINKSEGEYVMSFYIYLPVSADVEINGTESYYSYPGGDKFYYVDYASKDVLTKIKNSEKNGDAYKKVDVDKIIEDISFKENYNSLEVDNYDQNKLGTTILNRSFEIRIAADAFENFGVAQSFMTELADYPITLFSEMDINYNVYLGKEDFDNALDFETQIKYIQSQIDYISGLYGKLSNIADEEGNLVLSKWQKFNAWVSRIDLTALNNEAIANNYLKDWKTSLAKFEDEIKILEKERDDAQQIINSVNESIKDNTQAGDAASTIAKWQEKVTACQSKIDSYEGYKAAYYNGGSENEEHIKATEEYARKIQKVYDELTASDGYISAYSELSKEVYEIEAAVSFLNPDHITHEAEGMAVWKALLISLVIAIIVALIVAYIVGYVQKKKVTAQNAEITVSDGEKTEENLSEVSEVNDNAEQDK